MTASDNALLARVRHSLRALNGAIETGAKAVGLTVQQQAFLLALAARGGTRVPLAEVRADLGMDQATMSEMLARLIRRGYVARQVGRDRRAANVSLTNPGRALFRRSVQAISREMRAARASGELDGLQRNLREYLAFYTE